MGTSGIEEDLEEAERSGVLGKTKERGRQGPGGRESLRGLGRY